MLRDRTVEFPLHACSPRPGDRDRGRRRGAVVGFALGTQFGQEDVERILVTLYCLVAWVLASAGSIFAIVELLARGALGRLAALAAGQVAALVVLAPVGAAWNGIEGIAVALSVTVLGAGLVQLRWAYGARWRSAVSGMAAATGRNLGSSLSRWSRR